MSASFYDGKDAVSAPSGSTAQTNALSPVPADSLAVAPLADDAAARSTRIWLLSIAAIVLVLLQIGFCTASLPVSLHGQVDFKAFYTAGHLVLQGQGHQLFNYEVQKAAQDAIFGSGSQTLPFLYPPYAALFFTPLALFSYRTAFLLFLGINLACLAIAAHLLCIRIPALKSLPWVLQFGLFLSLFPVSIALMQGQVSFLMLLRYVAMEHLIARRMNLLAGLLLALGMVKFQVALPIALLFLAWGFYRLFAGFLLGAVALALESFRVSGLAGVIDYWHSTTQLAGVALFDPAAAKLRYGMSAGDMPNLRGYFFSISHGHVSGIYLAAASLAVMVWAWKQRPSIAVAMPAAMLVSYHLQPYDLTLLLLPLTLEIGWVIEQLRMLRTIPAEAPERRFLSRSARNTKLLLIFSIVLLIVPVAPFLMLKGLGSLEALPVVCLLLAARTARHGLPTTAEFVLRPA